MIVNIDGLDDFGRGISHDLDKICFIPNSMIGEKVSIEIIKNKKKYYEGKITEYIYKSPLRQKSICPYEDICGGCQIPFFSEQEEINFKKNKFKNIMHKFASVDISDIKIESRNRLYYRNKITLSITNGSIALIMEGSNKTVRIDKCLISNDVINSTINKIYDIVSNEKNITKIVIKTGNKTKEVLLSISGQISNKESFLKCCDVLVVNGKVLSNKKYISSYILNNKFYLSNHSFFQVNHEMTNILYSFIRDKVLECKSNNVLDLYCGVGTIGITIANVVNKVYGIEIVDEAIKMADMNRKLNNVNNIKFKSGDVGKLIYDLDTCYDTYILDPPRSGVAKNIIDEIFQKMPRNIIYVSCDPVTLARDVKILKEKYDVKEIRLFNMFPRTYHIESVCILKQK